MKKKHKSKWILFLMFLLITGIGICAYFIYNDWQEQRIPDEQTSMKPNLQEQGVLYEQTSIEPEIYGESTVTDGEGGFVMDFAGLHTQNSGIIAWLTIEGTVIDYPIVQTSDNSYYLTHGADNAVTSVGALFLDYRVSSDFSDFNNVIYGHNLRSGKMFGTLRRFKEKDYFDDHQTGWLYTETETYKLEIFAVSVTTSTSDYYKYAFPSPSEKTAHLEMIRQNSRFWKEIELDENDCIVALSTCSSESQKSRTVVHAKIADVY